MENILVVDAVSTGQNYIEDITYRGYHPVALKMKVGEGADTAKLIEESYKAIKYPCNIIEEQDTYEETLELVKNFNPIVIVPGSENGVVLANRLAADLGLKGNPIERIDQMTKKNAMHDALKDAGLRYIKGRIVFSPEEALEFCRENNFKTAVIKPLESAGSVGVTLCNDLNEVEQAVALLFNRKDAFGRPIDRCLVQERIVGNEFIVNIAASAGKLRLTSILYYTKVRTSEGGYIYNRIEVLEHLTPGIQETVRYAFDTAKAIGIQYGMMHGEFMIDEKGPVLIEVNCRPMGCSMPPRFLDKCFGHHETDVVMDAYLDPEKFIADTKKPYKTNCGAALKLLMVPNRLEAESMPIRVIAENLRSTYKIAVDLDDVPIQFVKTIDLESAGGIIYMIHDDPQVLHDDLNLLEDIEKKYFGLLVNDGMTRRLIPFEDHMQADLSVLIKENGCHGSTLLVSDNACEIKNVLCITPSEKDNIGTGFDNVVISLEQYLIDHKTSENMRLIFEIMKKAKKGGHVIISENTYRYMSYKEHGAEILLRVLGIEIKDYKPEDKTRAVVGIVQ